MKKTLFTFLFFVCAHTAQAAVLSEPEDAFAVMPIEQPEKSQTYYGILDGFPHTYDFAVSDTLELEALLTTAEKLEGKDTLSVLITKLEKRGVSEVGRVTGSSVEWEPQYDRVLALKLRESNVLAVSLESAVYRLEVSSPSNDRGYQLRLNGGSRVTYNELFTARTVFDRSSFGVILSWKIFIPVVLIVGALYFYKRKKVYVA